MCGVPARNGAARVIRSDDMRDEHPAVEIRGTSNQVGQDLVIGVWVITKIEHDAGGGSKLVDDRLDVLHPSSIERDIVDPVGEALDCWVWKLLLSALVAHDDLVVLRSTTADA